MIKPISITIATITFLFTTVAAVQADTPQVSGNQPSFTPPAFDYDSIADQPHDVDYWQEIATNAVVVGDYPNALAAFDKAVDLANAGDPELLEQRGWVHFRLGAYRFAIADLRAAAALYLETEAYDAYVNARRMMAYVERSASLPTQVSKR